MLLSNWWQYAILSLVAIALFGTVGFDVYNREVLIQRLEACNTPSLTVAAKIDCWQDIMREKFDAEGTAAAFSVFEIVYQNYPDFAETGCHRHAHRVGDMAYYFDFLTHRDISQVEFPKGATACGYGFYHGFFEHMIQDRPDPTLVEEICEYAKEHMVDVAPAIGQTCYHGSGHGFLLARVDEILAEHQWDDVDAFIMRPLEQCEQLTGITETELRECREGVYNVFTDWMATGEYGLSLDKEDPYALCKEQTYERQKDCYAEMSQKLDWFSDFDPKKMVRVVQATPREDLHELMLGVGVAGLIQHRPLENQSDLLEACMSIEKDSLRHHCMFGIIGGLVEHSTPGSDYQGAITFCALPAVLEQDRRLCYREVLTKLERFLTQSEIQQRCQKNTLPEQVCEFI